MSNTLAAHEQHSRDLLVEPLSKRDLLLRQKRPTTEPKETYSALPGVFGAGKITNVRVHSASS